MSVETQLREAFSARADQVGGLGDSDGDPYSRVAAAIAVSRRRRRTATLAGVAAVVALAVAIPSLAGGSGRDTTTPAKKTTVIPGPTDPRWTLVSTWPIRGSLAGDQAFISSFRQAMGPASVIYAGDIGADRVVVTWDSAADYSETLQVYAGDRGAHAAELTTIASAPQTAPATIIVRRDSTPDGWMLVLTRPGTRSAEVSTTATIHEDGTVTRSWRTVPIEDGATVVDLHQAPVALTRVRVGGYDGGVFLVARSGTMNPDAEGFCANCTGQDFLDHAVQGTNYDVATTLGLRTEDVSTTTLVDAKVDPAVLAVSSLGDGKPDGSTGRIYVGLTRLPGGQVVRTVQLGVSHKGGGMASAAETAVPIDAATAEQRPVVLYGWIGESSPTRYQVFAPNAASVRLVGDDPAFPKTATKRVVRGSATFSLNETGVSEHRLVETYDASGSLTGTWPVDLPNRNDPYDVEP
ncbi:hypothetical protein [Phycicoccus sp. Soil803]|uniref:hypothetical protein n=1 Tax=Phycicoccus sp. Soil803 TaxID=1736415 RepID=UPI000708CB00|nr:hypothetical protein [Phycicoccus sp. Soil803]KRF23616.1 hypothetical protein ASG95_02715 [Phycicoccus sp. Soil803]